MVFDFIYIVFFIINNISHKEACKFTIVRKHVPAEHVTVRWIFCFLFILKISMIN